MLCYKYISVLFSSLEHLFSPEEYAIAFNTTKSYSKKTNDLNVYFVRMNVKQYK